MTTRGYFQKIQPANIQERNTGYITESTTDAVILVVQDQRTSALYSTSVPHFSFSSSKPTGILHLQIMVLPGKTFKPICDIEAMNMSRTTNKA